LTGGTSNGGTQVVVTTNDHLGYSMTIMASSSVGMIGNASSSNSIPAYVTATPGVPDYTFTVPANKAYFGYTVEASTTADLATSFKDSASACNAPAGGDTASQCWIAANFYGLYDYKSIISDSRFWCNNHSEVSCGYKFQSKPNDSG
jgi:hypothetical protein